MDDSSVGLVFGPLNGVRTALVIGAFAAAVAAFFTGYALAGAVLLGGVGIHGLGWLYLYRQGQGKTRPIGGSLGE